MSAKILFLKKLANGTRATSAVIGPMGFHWRTLTGDAALAASLLEEHFELIVVDHRSVPGDPLLLLRTLEGVKVGTPVFLISDQPLELEKVIQAIRLSVKDVFHPPLDLKLMVERLQVILRPNVAPAGFEIWSEFVMFLAEGEKVLPAHARGAPAQDAAARLVMLELERGQMATERQKLQQAAADAQAQVDELNVECARMRMEHERLLAARESAETEQMLQTQVRKKSATGAAAATAVDREKIEAEKNALNQQRQKLLKESAEWQAEVEETKLAQARRARELDEIAAAHAEAAAHLTTEHEEFEAAQLVAEQAQTRMDEVVAELQAAAEKLKLQRKQMAAEHRKTDEDLARRAAELAQGEKTQAAEKQALEALRTKLQAEQRDLAKKEGELETAEVTAKTQAGKFKKAQDEHAAERAALAAEVKAHAEKQRQFETKQQQVRDQMKQLLTANL